MPPRRKPYRVTFSEFKRVILIDDGYWAKIHWNGIQLDGDPPSPPPFVLDLEDEETGEIPLYEQQQSLDDNESRTDPRT